MVLLSNRRGITLLMMVAVLGMAPTTQAAAPRDAVSAAEVKQEAKDLVLALKGYGVSQKEQAVKRTGAALDQLDRRIAILEARVYQNWDQMNKAARDQARASLTALRKQRLAVAESYGSLKTSSADAWEHMKKGFSEAWICMQDAWSKAEQEFDRR
jgi:hypothetical protein